jgi:hypothetical protein
MRMNIGSTKIETGAAFKVKRSQNADTALAQTTIPRQTPSSLSGGHCPCGGGCPRCGGATTAPLAMGTEDNADEHAADRATAALAQGAPANIDRAGPIGAPAPASSSSSSSSSSSAPDIVREPLSESGSPLPTALRSEYASRMGHDFSSVRVHTGATAARATTAVDADAYTVGSHIVFANDRYAPQSAQGRNLLGHELAHVVQQSSSAPRVQRRKRKPSGAEKAEKFVKDTTAWIGKAIETAEQDAYVRSIIGDFVRSDRLLDYSFVRKQTSEHHRSSTLTTETYFIAVKQTPDGKQATKPWAVIVDRRVKFDLHGKYKGRYGVRDFARLSTDYGSMPSAQKLIHAPAYETSKPDTIVSFDTPQFFSAFVNGGDKPAPTLAKRAKSHALFAFDASAKARVEALEKLIPGFVPDPVADPDGDRTVRAPQHKRPDPPSTRKRSDPPPMRVPDTEPSITEVPSPAPVPKPVGQTDRVQEQLQDGGKIGEVQTETAKKEEDHWYSGLLRALLSIAKGIGIFAAAVAIVVGAVFLATGAVIALPVAAAIAGAFLLGYGIGTALRQRFGQKEYTGRPLAAIGRALLDATGITGIQEAITGNDAGTGKPLTEGERTERGTLGGVNLLTLLWGGLKGGRGKTQAPKDVAPTPVEPVPTPKDVAPTPVEPVPTPKDVAPTPVEPVPTPKDVSPTPVEPVPTPKDVAPTPVEPVPTPKDVAPSPVEPPIKQPTEPPVPGTKPKGRARALLEDARQGLRDAMTRLEAAIEAGRENLTEINKEKITAQREMLAAQKRVQGMNRSDPMRADALAEFQKAKIKFEELQAQYDFRKSKLDELLERKAQYAKALNDKTYERPGKYNAGVEDAVWEQALAEGGGVVKSPSGKVIGPNDPWVMGHKPGFEFWKHQVSAARRGLSRDQFLREINDPSKYRPETVADNSSHRFEAPDHIDLWP